MKDISDLIARKEYLPATEDIQKELVELFGERRVEQDSLIQNFASGMISGAIAAPLSVLGPIGAIAAPGIINTVSGRTRNVQVLNSDAATKLLTRSKKNNKNNPTDIIHEPGVLTYIFGFAFCGAGAALSTTPLGPILMGLGLGMIGTGISSSAEAGGEEARRRRRE
ncbi:MAG: hypothetical protein ACRDAI_01800 [Candidatus Rhabdochlamydia sp.]